jgi:putative membrane protein insertion efficiency factor
LAADPLSAPAATQGSKARGLAGRIVCIFLLGAIRGYQLLVSPWLGANCRFLPTCSEYAAAAIAIHGPWRGGGLALKRLARCRPGGGSGYDPVPEDPNVRNVKREL